MKKAILIITVIALSLTVAVGFAACSSGSGFWKASNIDIDVVSKIEIVNVGGTIKTLEGERLDKFMDELGKLSVKKDDDGYPDASYDYCLRIYIEGKDGYLRYYLGQELTKVNIKSGAKESFYYFNDYDAARDLVAKYFYER
ncbi:MAG TPA: hypothetical protein IAB11_06720 [Candidatus Ornithoclostridium faecavium]|nr:hypothetical protein [Candidatus Ornithoclostridium faecavium]